MRRGEALGLRWKDIDLKNGIVDINKTRLYVNKAIGTIDDTPKNETSKRIISIPKQAVEQLREWKIEQMQNFMKLGIHWDEETYLFTSWNGKPMHPDTPSKWFTDFLKKNNLPQVHIHSLRHTNASLLIANGVDIKTVSKRLGHSSIQTTGVIYTHAIQKADKLASEQLRRLPLSILLLCLHKM